MPTILDGKGLADIICDNLHWYIKWQKLHDLALTIITTDPDKANQLYLKNKIKRCKEIGIDHTVIEQPELDFSILDFAKRKKAPVIIQAPFKNSNGHDLNSHIKPAFDADGFISKTNVADLYSGAKHICNEPCTPLGIITLLKANRIPMCGEHVCILGRSEEVGKPLAAMMTRENATVSMCNSYTDCKVQEELLMDANIIVSAIGSPEYIGNIPLDYDKFKDKVLVDVGINHVDGKLYGDISQKVKDQSRAYTPVPGGVGPMTVAMLMYNVVKTYSTIHMNLEDFCTEGYFFTKYQAHTAHNWLMN